MKRRLIPLALLLPALMQAQTPAPTDAEVRKIDTAQHTLTLRHAEIPHLDMAPMTMVFQVPEAADRALLPRIKPGAKLRFVAEQREGRYIARALELKP
jgi:Cu(I)/Ag(I) efflux system periplasmic protein CusF